MKTRGTTRYRHVRAVGRAHDMELHALVTSQTRYAMPARRLRCGKFADSPIRSLDTLATRRLWCPKCWPVGGGR